MKIVYTVVDRGPGKASWTKIGVGFVNRDGSLNLKLDALPTNGTLQVRDWEERDGVQRPRPSAEGQNPARTPSPSSLPPRRNESGPVIVAGENRQASRSTDAAGGLA